MKLLLAVLISLSSLISFPPPAFAVGGPGDGGVPWPLGESKPHDVWIFEFQEDAHQVEIHRREYTEGQWLFDVSLSNVDGNYLIGKGIGIYDGKGYSFYIRDQWDDMYEFRSNGKGSEFILEVVYSSGKSAQYKKVKATRRITY